MRKLCGRFWACLLLLTTLSSGQEVPASFFGMTAHLGVIRRQPWPSIPFGSLRMVDTGTMWLDLEPQPGVYNWQNFDAWLDAAQAHHFDILFTFLGIPTWVSGAPNDPKCTRWHTPGSCHPPADIKEDGSGSAQQWKEFVKTVATRAHGRIKYWEVWNEPHNLFFWDGTMAQMVRMTQELRTVVKSVDPDALIVGPGTGWVNAMNNGRPEWNPLNWTDEYLKAGGKSYIDVLSVHGYVKGQCPSGKFDMDELSGGMARIHKILEKNGIPDMPVWSSEGSWGVVNKTCTTDPDIQVAFVAQYYLLGWANGLKRMYWYAWNDGTDGKLWDSETGDLPAAKAYAEVYKWMVGSFLSKCYKEGSRYTCELTRPDGFRSLAIWDTAKGCQNGSCTTTALRVDPAYVNYLDLAGGKNKIQNSTVPVGLKPILLEASTSPSIASGDR
jgi:polysaccharide biosynthesis protein PslG